MELTSISSKMQLTLGDWRLDRILMFLFIISSVSFGLGASLIKDNDIYIRFIRNWVSYLYHLHNYNWYTDKCVFFLRPSPKIAHIVNVLSLAILGSLFVICMLIGCL
jgi:hypothetical protein